MRICIVEDNRLLLDSLRELLDSEEDIQVVACHESAEDAIEKTDWKEVDILLVDIELPHMSGNALIRQLHPLFPNISILVYTVHEDSASVIEAVRSGACGYLVKGCDQDELISSLREVFAGGSPMTPRIARYVLGQLQTEAESAIPEATQLTVREVTILQLLERGHSNKEITLKLGVSPHTIHAHIKNIYGKLQAHSRIEAIRKGRVRGIL